MYLRDIFESDKTELINALRRQELGTTFTVKDVQHVLKAGYNRAIRLLETMEAQGLIESVATSTSRAFKATDISLSEKADELQLVLTF